jgi:hypothetical protein
MNGKPEKSTLLNMRNLLFFIIFSCSAGFAQPASYSTANAHSHNDYQQSAPFFSAYNLQFGSIEVDVYLHEDELLVAHTAKDIPQHRTLEDLYLKPLQGYIQKNNGYPYADTSLKLQLMLDIKSEATATINKLIGVLIKYPEITRAKSFKLVISGSKPDPSTYTSYPFYMWFDGLLGERYNKEALTRIAMLCGNFVTYSSWKGKGTAPTKDWAVIKTAVERGHKLGKPVRLWNTPDFFDVWDKLTEIGVDYIDSDSIKALAEFLKQQGGNVN